MGEEERDPVLETAMEYAGALGVIIFDESCRLRDLTKAQIGRNQYAHWEQRGYYPGGKLRVF